MIEEGGVSCATWKLQGRGDTGAERRRQILVGAIRIHAPANARGEGERLGRFPGVGEVGTETPAWIEAARKTKARPLGEETISVSKVELGRDVVKRIAWVQTCGEIGGDSLKGCQESGAEELGESPAGKTVHVEPELDVVRALGPGAVIAELLVGLEGSLWREEVGTVRTGCQPN